MSRRSTSNRPSTQAVMTAAATTGVTVSVTEIDAIEAATAAVATTGAEAETGTFVDATEAAPAQARVT
jgi:hypothetical protein